MLAPKSSSIYLYRPPIDFRKAINGLALLVEEVLQHDSMTGHWFVFTNKRRDRIKILYWEYNGYCLWIKRLEQEKFHWPKLGEAIYDLSHDQLRWLLEGYNINTMKPHKKLSYQHV